MYRIFQIKPVAGALIAIFATTLAFPSAPHAQEASHRHEYEHRHARGNMGASPARDSVEEAELETLVVTAPLMEKPLEVRFDPKAPQQPLPANDGASFLKTIPGMSVIRKGGTDGDPVFRGMAASRL
ncbi:MAG: hypothetical protein LBC91_04125, partial [Candidatus Accumulibacter sp.]|nr:hypothetical protein [Accumulibacter sp.]